MVQGRDSARAYLVTGVALLCLLALTNTVFGALPKRNSYTVGDTSPGWTYNVNNWPSGKTFKVGDVLVFTYAKEQHNVVRVSKKAYLSCTKPKKASVHQTGRDRFTLKSGSNYFICAIPGHCQNGMKINVTTTA